MRAAACRLIKGWNFNAGLLSVMESDQQTAPQIWTSCKLIIDPLLTNGFHKVYRFDGQHFNIPVRDLGVFPVNAVRDPRICRLWSGSKINDFTVPKFKVDECYVGPIPPKEVTFVRLNDNVKEGFLTDMCNKYGHVDEVEIFYNPKSKKHLGIGKVVFDTVKAAKDAAQHLHQTSVMGNIIHVEIDPKGANRQRYLQLLFDGLCDPWTLPVGSDEETLQRFIDKLSGCKPTEREASISSPSSICTSLSLDTAYSSIWQDTPYSFGLTPQSQGTPRTPCLSGTPLSQDSCYSSLQATPVHQGEQSILSVHTLSRREVYSRKRARHFGRRHNSSDISFIVKHLQPQHFLPDQMTGAGPSLRPALCSQNTISSDGHHTETSLPECSEVPTTSLNVNISSPIILSINVAAEKGPVYQSRVTELPASPVDAAREGLHPELESLDSRIEMLLNKSKSADGSCFDDGSLEAAGAAENFPASDLNSLYGTPGLDGSPPISKKPSSPDGLVDVSPTPLPDTEEEETVQAVASLLRVTTSPLFKHMERRVNGNQASKGTDKKRPYSFSCPKEHHAPNEETETLKRKSAAFISIGPSSMPQHPPLPLFRGSCQLPPPRPLTSDLSGHSPLPVHPFTFPIPSIPPPIPPFSVHLPINFPPPGWIPPPVLCSSITVPPPSIPPPLPPTSLLGPPHPLIAPPVVHPYPSHRQPAEPLDKENLLRQASASFVYRPPWPSLPLAQFNPFVPPPGYVPVRENPHKATMDKVLEVIVEELKSIIKKDITRRMIEGTAFNAFDEWWGCQEHKAKVAESPSKARLGRMDEKAKPINPLRPIIGRHESIPLPSFKVKRKGASGACRSEGLENTASAHQKEYQIENPELEKGSDRAEQPSEDLSGAGCPTLKRRHARPIQLESDDDEASEDGDTQQEADITPDKEEASTAVNNATQVQFDIEDHDVQGADEAVQRPERTGVQVITSKSADAMHYSDSEFLSDATSSSSEESECSSHFDSCESSSSAGTEVSSDDDSSSEEDEFTEEDRSEECIVISSDEESMELEAPATPLAPLTPGAQLELTMQEWLVGGLRTRLEEDQCLGCVQDPGALDPVMAIQTNGNQDLLRPPSPIGIQVREPFDLEMESPEWVGGSLLRPLTPTGSLEDSDPDLLLADKPLPPAAKSVERPRTPGRGGAALSDGENSESELFSLPPASPASDLFPAAIHAPYPTYQDMPKTPGTEERSGWTPFGSARCPATPGRDTSPSAGSRVMSPPLSSPLPLPLPLPSLSNNPYIKTPKTPGRDMHLHCRAAVCRKRRNTVPPLSRDDFLGGSPIMVSCPCSLSDSSAETPVPKGARIGAGAASKPLQGLENMPGLLHEENRRGPERALLRTEQRRWRRQRMRRRRRWMRQRRRQTMAAPSPGSPPWSRSQCEETNILHDVWSEGLDEEDEQLLQAMYERLLREDSGCGWLSDTRWIPHPPLTRIRPEKNEEHDAWPGSHVTGSARSEGFYKISRRDKMKYLNDTQLTLEPPSASTQRSCTSASQQTSLRAGSDFRSEQRRLLSFFSCDSDLVKFNQLQYRKKMIRFCRSHIHDWGLFAMEPIAVDEMVIEYVGQTIRQVIADMREKRYEDEGIGSSYLFRIDQDIIIDATKCGNLARFINHSCNPNCYAKIITVESQKKIVIYSRQQISIHEEITYDYKFPIEDEKIPCLCGAEGCRGTLN